MNNIEMMSLIATILLALLGYFVTYLNNLRLARRADRLKYITQQLEEFYGPLFASTQISKILYDALKQKTKEYPETEKNSEWMLWVEHIFLPLNNEIERVIINKGYLSVEKQIHPSILQFCAHNSIYNTILQKWKKGDYSELYSIIVFPRDIESYARESFIKLKREQFKLMGRRDGKTAAQPT